MIASDFAVQIKLIIMYVIGVLVVAGLLLTLVHRQKRWFSKFTVPLMAVFLVMAYVLVTVIRLS